MSATHSRWQTSSVKHATARRPTIQHNGFEVFDQLLDSQVLSRICQEAMSFYPSARRCEVKRSDDEPIRGGRPARAFFTAPGGPEQDALYYAMSLLQFLAGQLGARVVPSGRRGTYTYYVCAGDHLAIHRDVRTCDVAVITCLHENGVGGAGGALRLYPGRSHESLLAIRKAPDSGALDLRLQPAQTLVLLGGVVPHCVLPTTANQSRIVSVLCFEMK